jgi:uncharacterized protein YecE (DUF72 family)
MLMFHCGCAGWGLPKSFAEHFPAEGSHLERYAARFSGVEINSSFYRPHRVQTYSRWAASVANDFRFAVKVPKSITHEHRLLGVTALLDTFLAEVAGLGDKLGPLLVQLPPSLAFAPTVTEAFFSSLRDRSDAQIVCEPRHASWFTDEAQDLLTQFRIARAAVDPIPVPQAREKPSEPGGWQGLAYYRLHGSPIIYRSPYLPEFLDKLALSVREKINHGVPTWCIFDNTAEGEATGNALDLSQRLTEIKKSDNSGSKTQCGELNPLRPSSDI